MSEAVKMSPGWVSVLSRQCDHQIDHGAALLTFGQAGESPNELENLALAHHLGEVAYVVSTSIALANQVSDRRAQGFGDPASH